MYGMVNRAMEGMLAAEFGDTAWAAIMRRAGVRPDVFITTQSYPDEITYRLVTAASECTGLSPDELLHRFGEYWILHTVSTEYGALFSTAGASVSAVLSHLPHFHDRISLLFPDLVPPRFAVTDSTPNSLRLHYASPRSGLTPFVAGLLSGIGRKFNTPLTITLEQTRASGAAADVFHVRW